MADNETAKVTLTKEGSHRATQRGYASKQGITVEDGELVPAGIPVSTEWMEPTKGSRALEGAIDEASDVHPKDVDLTQLSKAALEAMAAERGINVGGLSKKELETAIKAHVEKDAG